MNDIKFQVILQNIRDNVDGFIKTGDSAFLESNKLLWAQLREANRSNEASEILQTESLNEMEEIIADLLDQPSLADRNVN